MVKPIDTNEQKSIPRKAKRKSRVFWVVCILLLLVSSIIAGYYVSNKIINTPLDNSEPKPYKEGPGGDPRLVTKYHDQAVIAWKAGDKEKAIDLAKKGLNENEQLTIDQQGEVPSQATMIFDLYDISQGRYYE